MVGCVKSSKTHPLHGEEDRHRIPRRRRFLLAPGWCACADWTHPVMVVVAISIPVSTYGNPPNSLKLMVLKGMEIARKPRGESGCVAKNPLTSTFLSSRRNHRVYWTIARPASLRNPPPVPLCDRPFPLTTPLTDASASPKIPGKSWIIYDCSNPSADLTDSV